MMNPEIKQKWVDALRSGKYKQGYGKLKDGNEFCCLGVLCEVVGERISTNQGSLDQHFANNVGLHTHGQLPKVVRARGTGYGYLTSINDEAKLTFPEIADIIEEQL